jgi:hypothetical protein
MEVGMRKTPLLAQAMHAKRLKTGTCVEVWDDNGSIHNGIVEDEPWLLGGHTWVVNVRGTSKYFRAFNVMRVQPIAKG